MNNVYLAFLIAVAALILVPLAMQADQYFRRKEIRINPDDERLKKSLTEVTK